MDTPYKSEQPQSYEDQGGSMKVTTLKWISGISGTSGLSLGLGFLSLMEIDASLKAL